MKKKVLFSALLLSLSLGLSACNIGDIINGLGGKSGEQSQNESDASNTSDSGVISGKQKGDANWVDYASNGSVKLGLDYVNKDFYVDGVGQFSLKTAIDGDTAHFTPLIDSTHQGTMKARFYGIDTPESTGKVLSGVSIP